jgi:NAD(P)H-dependent flavin oxidoreductase YrpB (nitropropane dioxygenase family)
VRILSVSCDSILNKFCSGRVGTRFVAAVEASAPKKYKELICSAGFEDAVTTLIFTGRPLRVRRTPYIEDWNLNCQAEIKELTAKGKLPHEAELEKRPEISLETRPWLIGRVSAVSLPLAFSRRLI